MTFSLKTLSMLVVLSLALSGLAVFLLAAAGSRRRSRLSSEPNTEEALQSILDGHGRSIGRLEAVVRRLAAEDRREEELIRGAVQHVGMVRYDAFEDVGGRLSFSCAMLDDRGDGVVITSINGRQDTRVYAKPVSGGRSVHNLSGEEVDAIRQALSEPEEAVSAG